MSGKAELNLSVLFAHELRYAAKCLKDAEANSAGPEKLATAFEACWVALYHVMENPERPIVAVELSEKYIKESARLRKRTELNEKRP